MGRRKRLMFIGIAVIAIVGSMSIRYRLVAREKLAVHVAQSYLLQQYPKEMQYKSVRFS